MMNAAIPVGRQLELSIVTNRGSLSRDVPFRVSRDKPGGKLGTKLGTSRAHLLLGISSRYILVGDPTPHVGLSDLVAFSSI